MTENLKSDGTVGKALGILDAAAGLGRPFRFSELLEHSSLPKATLFRFLQTLTRQGMLSHDPVTQNYSLGIRLVRLAHSAWKQSSLAPIARPYIDQLATRVGETVHLAQMDRGQVLYVDKRNAAEPIEMFSQAGKVGPGYCTGIGKVIMAFMQPERQAEAIRQQAYYRYTDTTLTSPESMQAELDQIRIAGVAFDREEHEPGIICIAAPILSDGRQIVGGVSITSSTTRYNLDELGRFKQPLLETVQKIGIEATNWQFPC